MTNRTEILEPADLTAPSQSSQQNEQPALQIPAEFAALNDCYNPPPIEQTGTLKVNLPRRTPSGQRRVQIKI
jgi:hypothetical protein